MTSFWSGWRGRISNLRICRVLRPPFLVGSKLQTYNPCSYWMLSVQHTVINKRLACIIAETREINEAVFIATLLKWCAGEVGEWTWYPCEICLCFSIGYVLLSQAFVCQPNLSPKKDKSRPFRTSTRTARTPTRGGQKTSGNWNGMMITLLSMMFLNVGENQYEPIWSIYI